MKARLACLLGSCLILAACRDAAAAPVVLDNMPAYNWYHGCGPTSAGSVVGYWDLAGLPNLFTASGPAIYQTANVQDQISSPEHNAKYDYTDNPDLSAPYTSIADWFGTSVDPLGFGWSWQSGATVAFRGYFGYRGYTAYSSDSYYSSTMWNDFVAQINKGFPVMLLVDSNGDRATDHFVAAFGYEDRGANGLWYAIYDTWSEGETVRWKPWHAMSSVSYGVSAMTIVTPPFQWQASTPTNWSSAIAWTGTTVPSTANHSAWIDNGGTANLNTTVNLTNVYVGWHSSGTVRQVSGGNLTAGALRIGDYAGSSGKYELASGNLTVGDLIIGNSGSGLLSVTGQNLSMSVTNRFRLGPQGRFTAAYPTGLVMTGTSFEIMATDPAAVSGLEQLRLTVQGGAARQCGIEAAGRDLGPAMNAFDSNFALGALTLGGSDLGSVSLLDSVDNNPAYGGAEALYTRELNMLAGATLRLNGLRLYFLKDGVPRQLLPGDANMSGDVDVGDYTLWFNNYGLSNAGWLLGDVSGDGTIDVADYTIWFNNYGNKWQQLGGASPVPEPLSCGILLLGGAGVLRRRRKTH